MVCFYGWINKLKAASRFFVFLWFFLLISNVAFAVTQKLEVDIYKTDQIRAEEVKRKFGEQIKKLAELLASPINFSSEQKMKEMDKLGTYIAKGINAMGDFAYLRFESVTYDDRVVFSISVVDKKDKYRLSYFLPEPKKDLSDPGNLIQKWIEYREIGAKELMYKENKRSLAYPSCPAHHCVYGFEHNSLKKYRNLFDYGVMKHKKELVSILKQDKNEEKRAAAAFLLAHLKSGDEVVRLLSPAMFDPSPIVRNNVMRVIGATLIKSKSTHFPIEKVLIALDFPNETDRNKALMIMSALVKNPAHANYVKKHAAHLLIVNLKMLQLNLHNLAYQILKEISGKNFAARDYKSWEQWAKSVQK